MKEKTPVRRVILSIISIAVIIAIVTTLIIASVRADEAEEDTHPAVTEAESAGRDEEKESDDTEKDAVNTSESPSDNESKESPEEKEKKEEKETETVKEKKEDRKEEKEDTSEDKDEKKNEEEKDPDILVGNENAGKDSSLLHFRQKPVRSKDFKVLEDAKSKYIVVMDADTNTIIAGKQEETRMFPASLTKVMTLLTAVDFLPDMNRTFSLTLEDSDDFYRQNASVAGYMPGEPAIATDMLYGLILPSGADCALGVANVTAGNMGTFASLMNFEACKMRLKDTHFTNTSGLHDDNNYSTVLDMAVIFRYALDNELCRKVLGTSYYKTEKTKEHPEGIEVWSHTFSYMTGVDMGGFEVVAGKTGYTPEAGACMLTAAKKGDKTYIVVSCFAMNGTDMCADHIETYKKIAAGKL